MLNISLNKIICFSLVLVFCTSLSVQSKETVLSTTFLANTATSPPVNSLSKKWRIGFYEGGQHVDYLTVFKATLNALMSMGWIKEQELPHITDHRRFWLWLAENMESGYIEFVPDAFYSSDFDRTLREAIREQAIERLNFKNDIDLMLGFGTWAGLDLANNEHEVNTLIISSSDPIEAGIVINPHNSGYEHIHVHIDPERYTKQVELFYRIIGFKKLGIVYENSMEGRSYASIGRIEALAEQLGFTLVTCHVPNSDANPEEAKNNLIACYKQLTKKVKAVYVTNPIGMPDTIMPAIFEPLIEAKTYTFSQSGSSDVRAGAMLSVEEKGDLIYTGRFYASNVAQVLNGASPGSLKQIYTVPSRISINLKTAEAVGYAPQVDILEIIDDFYGLQ